jgi:translation initiation factor 5B
MEKGLNAELYWENKELGSTVSLVPTSAISGEGINDLLHMLTRLSQTKLATHLSYSQNIQCTILEVKVIEGLGCTVDVILVNGVIDNGATIVVCTTEGPVVTQVGVNTFFFYYFVVVVVVVFSVNILLCEQLQLQCC